MKSSLPWIALAFGSLGVFGTGACQSGLQAGDPSAGSANDDNGSGGSKTESGGASGPGTGGRTGGSGSGNGGARGGEGGIAEQRGARDGEATRRHRSLPPNQERMRAPTPVSPLQPNARG